MKACLIRLATAVVVLLPVVGCDDSTPSPSPFSQTFTGRAFNSASTFHTVTMPRSGTATIRVTWLNVGSLVLVRVSPAAGGTTLGTSPSCTGFCSESALTAPVQGISYSLQVIGSLITSTGGEAYTLTVTMN